MDVADATTENEDPSSTLDEEHAANLFGSWGDTATSSEPIAAKGDESEADEELDDDDTEWKRFAEASIITREQQNDDTSNPDNVLLNSPQQQDDLSIEPGHALPPATDSSQQDYSDTFQDLYMNNE